MVWPNLALVLPLSLPLPSSRAFPSSCIINEPLILVRYKLGKLRKCWRFLSSSLPLRTVCSCCRPSSAPREEFTVPSCPYIHGDIHVASLNVTRARKTLPYYVQGFRTVVRIIGGWLRTSATFRTVRNLTDVRTTTVWEQTFDGYCTYSVHVYSIYKCRCSVEGCLQYTHVSLLPLSLPPSLLPSSLSLLPSSSSLPPFSGPAFIPYLNELPSLSREDTGPFRLPIAEKFKVRTSC